MVASPAKIGVVISWPERSITWLLIHDGPGIRQDSWTVTPLAELFKPVTLNEETPPIVWTTATT